MNCSHNFTKKKIIKMNYIIFVKVIINFAVLAVYQKLKLEKLVNILIVKFVKSMIFMMKKRKIYLII